MEFRFTRVTHKLTKPYNKTHNSRFHIIINVKTNILNRAIKLLLTNMFESVIVIIFKSVFHTEMHQNNVFLFFKNYF
jgi:hypothetical protein